MAGRADRADMADMADRADIADMADRADMADKADMANLKLSPHSLTGPLADSTNYKEMLSHLKIYQS